MADYDIFTDIPFEHFRPEQTALLVIDMQRYFVCSEHPLGKWLQQRNPEGVNDYFQRVCDLVIPNIQRLLERCRSLGICIAYTEFGSMRHDGLDMPGWARWHNDDGRQTVGMAVYPPFDDSTCGVDDSVAPETGEFILQKTTSGLLNSTKLDQTFRVLKIDTVVVTGVVTDVCVAQTAREFSDRDSNVIVIEDACATLNKTAHRATLGTIGRVFGAVVSTDQLLELLKG
jgi:nicotinamidase-related amidase